MESTEKRMDICKLAHLLVDGGTLALRICFDRIVSPQNLHKELQKTEIINTLKSLKSSKIISVSQWKNLFPPLIPSTVTSGSFDITLLHTLLSETVGLSDPSRGISVMADLERLRMYRNEIYSCLRTTEITEVEYEKIWRDLSKVLLRFGGKEIESAINDLEKDPTDYGEKEHYMEVLKKWYQQERNLPTKAGELSAEPGHKPFTENRPEEPQKEYSVDVYRAGDKDNDKPDFNSKDTGCEGVTIFCKKELLNFHSPHIVIWTATIYPDHPSEKEHIRKVPTYDHDRKNDLQKFYDHVFFADKFFLEKLKWKRATLELNEGRPNVDKGYMQRALLKYVRDNKEREESPQSVNELAELKAVSYWCWPNTRRPERVQPGKHGDMRIIRAVDYSKSKWEEELWTLRKSAGKIDDSDEDISDDSETQGLEEDIALCTLYLKEKQRSGKWPKSDREPMLEGLKKTIKADKNGTKGKGDSKEAAVEMRKLPGKMLEALNLMTQAALKLKSGDDPLSNALKDVQKCLDESDVDLDNLNKKLHKFQQLFFEAHLPEEMKRFDHKHIFQEFGVSEEEVGKVKTLTAGIRVVRGSDWMWKDQDGGEGGIGFVINPGHDRLRGLDKWVTVHWDHGEKARYRAGLHGECDLKIYDNSTAGVIHPSSSCSACGESPLRGMRWNCLSCLDVDLCTSCYMKDCHDTSHKFERIDNPGALGVQLGQRQNETKIQAQGIFPGATIQHQISGLKGIFKKWIKKYPGVVEIEDRKGKKTTLNLMEHNEVALDCRKSVQGGIYYKNHLPKFRFHYKGYLNDGDRVFLDAESIDHLERIDEDKMKLAGTIGTVENRVDGQQVVVDFNATRVSMKNYELTKVQQFEKGNRVRIIDNKTLVEKFYSDDKTLLQSIDKVWGKNGVVERPEENGYTSVVVGSQTFRVSPAALVLRPSDGEKSSTEDTENTTEMLKKSTEHFKLLQEQLFSDKDEALTGPEMAVHDNNYDLVKETIEKNPAEVNNMHNGRTLLHRSCHRGFAKITLFLLERGAEAGKKDSQGYTALHHSACGDQSGKTAKLLVCHGADVNAEGNHKETPLHLAVQRDNEKVAKHLINAECDVNKQDTFGDTPLHDAKDNVKLMQLILRSRLSNPPICNKRGFNALHYAAKRGDETAVKLLLSNCPTLLNTQKPDGYSSLHLACLNGHDKVLTVLLQEKEITVDALTKNSETALHLASKQCLEKIVKRLIERHANVNATDNEGNTPLHLAVQGDELSFDLERLLFPLFPLSAVMSLSRQSEQKAENIVYSLLKSGADPDRRNNAGKTSADICKCSKIEDLLQKASKQKRFEKEKQAVGGIQTKRESTAQQQVAEVAPKLRELFIADGASGATSKAELAPDSQEQQCRDISPRLGMPSCTICGEERSSQVIFTRCKHLTCKFCSEQVDKCPFCREPTKEEEKIDIFKFAQPLKYYYENELLKKQNVIT